ncbi:MAG: FxsA family protein [Planctomycetota bacterium]|nr:FxsA family protein [Planctomycetota bacterium]
MLKVLFFLFIAIPLVELWLLFELAALTNAWVAILCVVLTGFVGYWFARAQGWQAYQEIKQSFQKQTNPTNSLVDGLLILIAGVLLMTPGMITDLTGFMLLVPISRRLFRRWLIGYFSKRIQTMVMGQLAPQGEPVVGEAEEGVFEGTVMDREFTPDRVDEPDELS